MHSMRQHYFDTKTRQRHYNKRKLQANIPDEHIYKNINKILPNQIQQHIKIKRSL